MHLKQKGNMYRSKSIVVLNDTQGVFLVVAFLLFSAAPLCCVSRASHRIKDRLGSRKEGVPRRVGRLDSVASPRITLRSTTTIDLAWRHTLPEFADWSDPEP